MSRRRRGERGFFVYLILVAVALAGLVSAMISRGDEGQTNSSTRFRMVSEVQGQASALHAALMECELIEGNLPYIAGVAQLGTTDGSGSVNDLVCDHQSGSTLSVWGTNGRVAPRTMTAFSGWTFAVSGTSVTLTTTATTPADSVVQAVLGELGRAYSASEASVDLVAGTFTLKVRQ